MISLGEARLYVPDGQIPGPELSVGGSGYKPEADRMVGQSEEFGKALVHVTYGIRTCDRPD
jgi:hypothetical protein